MALPPSIPAIAGQTIAEAALRGLSNTLHMTGGAIGVISAINALNILVTAAQKGFTYATNTRRAAFSENDAAAPIAAPPYDNSLSGRAVALAKGTGWGFAFIAGGALFKRAGQALNDPHNVTWLVSSFGGEKGTAAQTVPTVALFMTVIGNCASALGIIKFGVELFSLSKWTIDFASNAPFVTNLADAAQLPEQDPVDQTVSTLGKQFFTCVALVAASYPIRKLGDAVINQGFIETVNHLTASSRM